MATLSVPGIGSNIDTGAIVKALVNAEKAPKQAQITAQKTTASATLSAIGSIKSALDTFREALAKLNGTNSFIGLTATSSNDKVATATSNNKAAAGNYALVVDRLATASKVTSAKVVGGASTVMTASATTLTLTQGTGTDPGDVANSYSIDIAANATLQQVRDAINTQVQSKGITANLVTDSNGDSRLVMSSTTTGAGTELSLSGIPALTIDGTVAGGAGAAGRLGDAPQDAAYTIDGLSMTSSTNSIDSAISGVALKLTGAGSSTVSVSSSTDSLKTSVQAFVDAYNTLMTAVNAQTKVTVTAGAASTSAGTATAAGALTGDATMRSLMSSVRTELTKVTGSGSLNVLSQIGVNTVQKTGLLELNSTKWDTAMKTGAGDVAGLFTGDDGLLKRLTAATDAYAQTGGILASRQTSLNTRLTNLGKDQAALDRRIESLTTSLTLKYNAMDTLVAQLTATNSSIMTTLNALNNSKSN
ncbi:flagellar filament capping protein FliD [Pseudomonas sp. LS1212]|uniref:flagellar filament capping protein FliD n=1 Tax=Pseudomonas sp. LS1212 TaxID=2972478 RepID=UPI00215D599F|nr:flagellar filament capping protein FliD [Pseudomonas sp. LS1212]UVJ45428.1 flagellar filament capping protein FliD [Pseudomonas sp. LS1212]